MSCSKLSQSACCLCEDFALFLCCSITNFDGLFMNYGFVKVAAAVPRVKVADCKHNANQIEKEIIIADGKGVQVIVFPELSITGYTCADLFAQQVLL